MNCPTCGNGVQTLQTRETSDGKATKRRKVCSWGHRFTTIEVMVQTAHARWKGLWLTDQKTFVLVPNKGQPRLLRENGYRVVSVNEEGVIFVKDEPIKLVEKRRGDESFTSTGELWPIVKE